MAEHSDSGKTGHAQRFAKDGLGVRAHGLSSLRTDLNTSHHDDAHGGIDLPMARSVATPFRSGMPMSSKTTSECWART